MPAKNALDALNDALESNGVPVSDGAAEENEENEELTTEESGEETPPTGDDAENDETDGEESGDETDGEGSDEETDEETDGEGEEDAEGEETEEGDEEAETPEAKAAREKAEKADNVGTGDILEDPIPKTLGPRGQERMRTLIATVKELQPDADIGRELIQHINASQMTADEFSTALTFGRLKHSDNVEDLRAASQILWKGLKELAPLIGETLPGVDPLEGHEDLKLKVASKEITPQLAAELAVGRNRRKADSAAAQRSQQNQNAANQRDQQNKRLEADVKKELNELGHDLSTNDPNFEAKMAVISKKDAQGNSIAKKVNAAPLGLRVNAFLKAYMAIKLPPKGAVPAAKKPGPQPMRAGKVPAAGGSGVRREAKTAVEAMNIALGFE